MEPSTNLAIGMAAAVSIVVTADMTVGHFVPGMPQVYATPMMILHMEMAAGLAVAAALPPGYVSVGMSVDIRHLAATPIGRRVRALARVKSVDSKSVFFEIEAWNDLRKIGAGTHRRGIVNVPEFERRSGVHQALS
ncbi:thioesterase [Bradyrhizobium sp. 159]|uniref:thioesterase family protein n=1 Tax=Bradyrhizobium sp. 159 TaxID=2782632 RepID=UPI001FFA90E2|nr:hotdog domain-containing protein [Bradyrhizobium sp. 159]MCK1616487.1 thioesterase [Bradyrhizobium sp. 159]